MRGPGPVAREARARLTPEQIAERKPNTMANNFTYFIAVLNARVEYDDNMRGQISKRNIDRWWDACEIVVKMDERIRALTTS
jgi:hypothetical protein